MIALDEKGITLLIPETVAGEEGPARSYSIAPAPPGLARWACTLTRLDTAESHALTLRRDGWTCSCRDRFYRPHRTGGCKHIRHVRRLYRFLLSLIRPDAPEVLPCQKAPL